LCLLLKAICAQRENNLGKIKPKIPKLLKSVKK